MSATFEMTAATDADREWCARLMAASDPWVTLRRGLEQCRAVCHRSDVDVIVARDVHGRDARATQSPGEPCGFAVVHPRGLAGSPYLASIAVAPAWRSRGVGAALLEFCERRVSPPARHFFLCVSSFNPRARGFYERQGYHQVGEFPDYIIDGASEILMHKRLV
ncbi:MAG TPA: N-acetyltransferase [Vicinamibacterales bacterium]